MPGNRWIKTTLLMAAIAGPCLSVMQARPVLGAAAEGVSVDAAALGATLNNAASPQPQRDEAARRLLGMRSADALQILKTSFANNASTATAIARAIAGSPDPDPQFIGLLGDALGGNRVLNEAAAAALANYQGNAQIFPLLKKKVDDRTLPDGIRAPIVKAMGGTIERPVAEYLIGLLSNANESQAIQDAAIEALSEITGLTELGQDRQRWQQWWAANGNQPDAKWRQLALEKRSTDFSQVRQQYTQLSDSLVEILRENYGMIPDDKKSDALQGFLNSGQPEVRAAGASLVSGDYTDGRPVPPVVRQRLRGLISDSNAQVRRAGIEALETINDREAAPALVKQLGQETEASIRQTIASALGRMGDLSAVPALLDMLNSPQVDEAAAAAAALKDLGRTLRQQDPAMTRTTVDALQAKLDEAKTKAAGAGKLRENCVNALAVLADPRSVQTFLQMIRPNEPQPIRVAALGGLEALEDPNAESAVEVALKDTSDPTVQLAAAAALKKIATFGQADLLQQLLDPAVEPEATVRDAVWQDLQSVLAGGTKEQLMGWPDRLSGDPEKKLAAQQALCNALEKDHDGALLAEQRQNMGETLMSLKRPDEASGNFAKAMDYWRGEGHDQPGSQASLDALVGDMTDALLAAGKYDEATTFAANQLKVSLAYQTVLGPRIKDTASALKAGGNVSGATRLIDDALNMNPPLELRYQHDLQQTRSEIGPVAPAAGATNPGQ